MKIQRRIEQELLLIEERYGKLSECTDLHYYEVLRTSRNNRNIKKNFRCYYLSKSSKTFFHYMIYFPDNYPFSPCDIYILRKGNFEKKFTYQDYYSIYQRRFLKHGHLQYDDPYSFIKIMCPCCESLKCFWSPMYRAYQCIEECENIYRDILVNKNKYFSYKSLNLLFKRKYNKEISYISTLVCEYL